MQTLDYRNAFSKGTSKEMDKNDEIDKRKISKNINNT